MIDKESFTQLLNYSKYNLEIIFSPSNDTLFSHMYMHAEVDNINLSNNFLVSIFISLKLCL